MQKQSFLKALSKFEMFLKRFGHLTGPQIRNFQVYALANKGDALMRLHRREEALATYGELLLRFQPSDVDDPTVYADVMFEVREIQDFFSDWKSRPILDNAYALAKQWGDDHIALR